ncbi:calcium-binding protein [uncultured Pelagimonas sp.]|uniref:calcium-binding protein n=1 Tax=uncultured Pelagimonas sp. TaxID=1618102 RepID=UPI00261AEA5D|nr:calcium-binding protein [uncultured Pelagimonas sp.]
MSIISTVTRLFGTSNDDVFDTASIGGSVIFNANGGNDSVSDTLEGGNDKFNGYAGDDTLLGGDGNDTLNGGAGADSLDGGAGDDDLTIDQDDLDTGYVNGGADYDIIRGSGAITGLDLTDVAGERFLGGHGDDSVSGGSGTTGVAMAGNGGNDTLEGSAGADRMSGNSGDDVLSGGAGDDTILGGAGADTMTGGDGFDMLVATGTTGVLMNMVVGRIEGGDFDGDVASGFEGMVGTNYNDKIVGNNVDNFLFGNAGNDTLLGGGGADTLLGGLGADDLQVDQADIDSGLVDAGGGLDIIRASGTLTIDMSAVNGERFFGGSGGDYASASGSESVRLNGYGGNDTLEGSSVNDTINGGNGDDVIIGDGGNDRLLGNGGSDSFVIAGDNFGADDVFDFSTADRVVFDNSELGADAVGIADITLTDNPLGVVVTASGLTGSTRLRGNLDAVDLMVTMDGNGDIIVEWDLVPV